MARTEASPLPNEDGRPPREVLPGLWLFAPSRQSQGGSSWLLASAAGDILIDCPGFTRANLSFLNDRNRSDRDTTGRIVLTGRSGHGRCRGLQQAIGWPVLVQEQEAYLLPGVVRLETFAQDHRLGEGLRLLWTPGHSPGSCVLHACCSGPGGGVDGLFCGRLLVPVAPGRLAPLRTLSSFHWGRQLASIERLRHWLPEGSPDWIATGAALGALRGGTLVRDGARQLAELDLPVLARQRPGDGR